MKKLLLTTALFLLAGYLYAQQVVPLDSIAKYDGKTVTVCAKVTGTHVTRGENKTTYLNFGKPYPDHCFTVVIFEKDLQNFGYKPADLLLNKNICVTAQVKIYKDKPEMIIKEQSQIKIE